MLAIFFLLCFGQAFAEHYVWNLGMAIACDITPFKKGLPKDFHSISSSDSLNPDYYITDVKEGDIIWLQSHHVAQFYYNVLPRIKNKFVLYISDGDAAFPSSYTNFEVNALIQDPKVIHIFAQNVDTLDTKVSGVPIGVDFHTVAHSSYCKIFGEVQQSVAMQEKSLEELLKTFLPTHQRLKKAFVDFHLRDNVDFTGERRSAIFNKIFPTGLIDAAPQRMARSRLWETKGKYAFSISPHGNGLDCHRTWEDLILGCIVIVKSSPLDPLYEGLPVVIVKDWSEITEENFDKWLIQYGDAFTNPKFRERLTHAYWMSVMRKSPIL